MGETLVISHNMELCYKMRTMHQQRMRQMKPSQLQILERLIILCFRCEAKLNLLLLKTKTSQFNFFEKQIKTNQHLIHEIDQQNMVCSLESLLFFQIAFVDFELQHAG